MNRRLVAKCFINITEHLISSSVFFISMFILLINSHHRMCCSHRC